MQIVRDDEYDPANESEIRAVFRARLGAGVLVDVEYVDAIAREKSGKFRYIVSHVQR